MGLDQYAIAIKQDTENQEIMYWRKHNRLEGWMEELWIAKGGTGTFNCKEVELTSVDLVNLESAIINRSLPQTGGFFFGTDSYGNSYDPTDDLEFISEARQRIEDGWKIIYTSWW